MKVVKISPEAMAKAAAARKRREEAKQELIAIGLRLQTILEPERPTKDQENDPWYWSERKYLEERSATLRQVIDETRADEKLL